MHQIEYFEYDLNVSKEKVEKDLNAYADRHSDGGGMPYRIEWTNNKLDSYEQALDYVHSHCGSYQQLAVQYLDHESIKKTKRALDLEKRIQKLEKEYSERQSEFQFKNTKTEFIGCKRCGSKISKKYLHINYCPVCRSDMRSQTVLNNIKKCKEKIEDTEKKLHNEMMKQKEKMKYKWLVKIEFHV